ncbi:MAG: Fe-Mn family superoxide dismutase [Patescibacteria group bacterium]
MLYTAQNFDNLLGLPGFSDTLLKNHFTLYQGYITNVNRLQEELEKMLTEGKTGTPQYNELKRRFGWEFNGMRMHEIHFGRMTKTPTAFDKNSTFAKKISEDFGTYENWEKDFKSTAAMRGIGWTVLYYDPVAKNLFNVWVNEHDVGHLAGGIPLLALDVFEHAYMLDYGLKRADYIEAFFKVIDWQKVSSAL